MCFHASKSAKCKVAEENIVCYKVLVEDDLSAIYCYKFFKGKLNPTIDLNIKRARTYMAIINKGYHSYKTIRIALHCGFAWDHIGKFIIPKGATYYSNRTEYVSDQIIFVERVKL